MKLRGAAGQALLLTSTAILTGCGVASISPLVTDSDLVDEPRLAGTWQDSLGKESAVITAEGRATFRVAYKDEAAKSGNFHGRLGRLGAYRVLDLQPDEPIPTASDVYKSLLLRVHTIVLVDSVGATLQFRLIEGDSLKAYVKRQPQSVMHAMIDDDVLLTGPTSEARRFLMTLIGRPGVLESNTWRR